MLWIALYLPDLPLQLLQRAQQTTALTVLSVPSGPSIAAPPRNEAALSQALHNLCCWACQFTPTVVLQEQEGLLLEVGSTLQLHRGLSRLLVRIGKGLTELGYRAEPGIAPTPLAAWLLAKARCAGLRTRMCKDSTLLPERLAPLPMALLDWPADVLGKLQTLGIYSIGQCLQLPCDGFIRRFGQPLRLELDKALGTAADPRRCFEPPDTFASRLEFGFELNDAMMLLFPLKRLLQEFEGFLRARGAGVHEWQLLLEHMNHGRSCIVIGVATPERSGERFLLLAREKLALLKMTAAVLALGIAADKLLEFDEHNRSLIPDANSRAIGWDQLIDKLVTRLSSDKVFRLRALDDHRPEQAWQCSEATMAKLPSAPALTIPRPLWLLRTPRPLSSDDGTPRCQGPLHFLAGPERIESGWWDDHSAHRDYYVARNRRGETLWIYREHQGSKHWFLHGVFA